MQGRETHAPTRDRDHEVAKTDRYISSKKLKFILQNNSDSISKKQNKSGRIYNIRRLYERHGHLLHLSHYKLFIRSKSQPASCKLPAEQEQSNFFYKYFSNFTRSFICRISIFDFYLEVEI